MSLMSVYKASKGLVRIEKSMRKIKHTDIETWLVRTAAFGVCVGLRWSLLAGVGRCWLALVFVGHLGPVPAGINLCWPSWACAGWHWSSVACVGLRWLALVFVDHRGPVLAVIGWRWPSLAGVGLRWPLWACAGCHGLSWACVSRHWLS